MFKRKAIDKMIEWKEKYSSNYALLLEGARRVGKTTIATYFAENYYRSYILIDFSSISKELLSVFDSISDLDIFFLRLQAITGITLYENESVIIFDEIQLQPKVRQAIKHLVKDGRYSYIETGSLISIKKNIKDIVIPSEEMKLNIYPMDYEEFLWANNKDFETLNKLVKLNNPIGQSVNRKLMRDFRIYMAVGGMPQAVLAYTKGYNFEIIDRIKREIIDLYCDDFRKIDSSGRISLLYKSIPAQLSLNKTRFVLSNILNKQITQKDEELLYELIDSKTVIPSFNVTEPSLSLNLTKDFSKFKLYLSDIGLFTTMLFEDKNEVSDNIYNKLLSDKLETNLGYLYENAIAQIINSNNRELYFHTWYNENKTSLYEIDFLVSDGNKIIPIEVKSSKTKRHVSIDNFSKKYSRVVSRQILFSQDDIGHDNMVEFKPIYLAPLILKEIK